MATRTANIANEMYIYTNTNIMAVSFDLKVKSIMINYHYNLNTEIAKYLRR